MPLCYAESAVREPWDEIIGISWGWATTVPSSIISRLSGLCLICTRPSSVFDDSMEPLPTLLAESYWSFSYYFYVPFSNSVLPCPATKTVLGNDHLLYVISYYEGSKRSIMMPPSLVNVQTFAEVQKPSKQSSEKKILRFNHTNFKFSLGVSSDKCTKDWHWILRTKFFPIVVDCSSETLSPIVLLQKKPRKQEKIKERRWSDETWISVLALLLIHSKQIRSAQSLTFLLWKMEGVAEIMFWLLPAHTWDHESPRPLTSRWHHGTEFWPMECGPPPMLDIKWSLPTCDLPPCPKVSKNLQNGGNPLTQGEAWMPEFTAWRRLTNYNLQDQTLYEWEQILFLLSHWDFEICYSN